MSNVSSGFLNSEKKTPLQHVFTIKDDAVVYENLSRHVLLNLLTKYGEVVNAAAIEKNRKPVFSADFANNMYTRHFIYPRIWKT